LPFRGLGMGVIKETPTCKTYIWSPFNHLTVLNPVTLMRRGKYVYLQANRTIKCILLYIYIFARLVQQKRVYLWMLPGLNANLRLDIYSLS